MSHLVRMHIMGVPVREPILLFSSGLTGTGHAKIDTDDEIWSRRVHVDAQDRMPGLLLNQLRRVEQLLYSVDVATNFTKKKDPMGSIAVRWLLRW